MLGRRRSRFGRYPDRFIRFQAWLLIASLLLSGPGSPTLISAQAQSQRYQRNCADLGAHPLGNDLQRSEYCQAAGSAEKTANANTSMTAIWGGVAATCFTACLAFGGVGGAGFACKAGTLGASVYEALKTKNVQSLLGAAGAVMVANDINSFGSFMGSTLNHAAPAVQQSHKKPVSLNTTPALTKAKSKYLQLKNSPEYQSLLKIQDPNLRSWKLRNYVKLHQVELNEIAKSLNAYYQSIGVKTKIYSSFEGSLSADVIEFDGSAALGSQEFRDQTSPLNRAASGVRTKFDGMIRVDLSYSLVNPGSPGSLFGSYIDIGDAAFDPNRLQYTLNHELGHLVRDHRYKNSYTRNLSTEGTLPIPDAFSKDGTRYTGHLSFDEINAHYRKVLDFSLQSIGDSKIGLVNLDDFRKSTLRLNEVSVRNANYYQTLSQVPGQQVRFEQDEVGARGYAEIKDGPYHYEVSVDLPKGVDYSKLSPAKIAEMTKAEAQVMAAQSRSRGFTAEKTLLAIDGIQKIPLEHRTEALQKLRSAIALSGQMPGEKGHKALSEKRNQVWADVEKATHVSFVESPVRQYIKKADFIHLNPNLPWSQLGVSKIRELGKFVASGQAKAQRVLVEPSKESSLVFTDKDRANAKHLVDKNLNRYYNDIHNRYLTSEQSFRLTQDLTTSLSAHLEMNGVDHAIVTDGSHLYLEVLPADAVEVTDRIGAKLSWSQKLKAWLSGEKPPEPRVETRRVINPKAHPMNRAASGYASKRGASYRIDPLILHQLGAGGLAGDIGTGNSLFSPIKSAADLTLNETLMIHENGHLMRNGQSQTSFTSASENSVLLGGNSGLYDKYIGIDELKAYFQTNLKQSREVKNLVKNLKDFSNKKQVTHLQSASDDLIQTAKYLQDVGGKVRTQSLRVLENFDKTAVKWRSRILNGKLQSVGHYQYRNNAGVVQFNAIAPLPDGVLPNTVEAYNYLDSHFKSLAEAGTASSALGQRIEEAASLIKANTDSLVQQAERKHIKLAKDIKNRLIKETAALTDGIRGRMRLPGEKGYQGITDLGKKSAWKVFGQDLKGQDVTRPLIEEVELAQAYGQKLENMKARTSRTSGLQILNQEAQSLQALAQEALGRKLSPQQVRALYDAHVVGRGEVGKNGKMASKGNYTTPQLKEKIAKLEQGGFSKEERKILLQKGIAGDAAPVASLELLNDIPKTPVKSIDARNLLKALYAADTLAEADLAALTQDLNRKLGASPSVQGELRTSYEDLFKAEKEYQAKQRTRFLEAADQADMRFARTLQKEAAESFERTLDRYEIDPKATPQAKAKALEVRANALKSFNEKFERASYQIAKQIRFEFQAKPSLTDIDQIRLSKLLSDETTKAIKETHDYPNIIREELRRFNRDGFSGLLGDDAAGVPEAFSKMIDLKGEIHQLKIKLEQNHLADADGLKRLKEAGNQVAQEMMSKPARSQSKAIAALHRDGNSGDVSTPHLDPLEKMRVRARGNQLAEATHDYLRLQGVDVELISRNGEHVVRVRPTQQHRLNRYAVAFKNKGNGHIDFDFHQYLDAKGASAYFDGERIVLGNTTVDSKYLYTELNHELGHAIRIPKKTSSVYSDLLSKSEAHLERTGVGPEEALTEAVISRKVPEGLTLEEAKSRLKAANGRYQETMSAADRLLNSSESHMRNLPVPKGLSGGQPLQYGEFLGADEIKAFHQSLRDELRTFIQETQKNPNQPANLKSLIGLAETYREVGAQVETYYQAAAEMSGKNFTFEHDKSLRPTAKVKIELESGTPYWVETSLPEGTSLTKLNHFELVDLAKKQLLRESADGTHAKVQAEKTLRVVDALSSNTHLSPSDRITSLKNLNEAIRVNAQLPSQRGHTLNQEVKSAAWNKALEVASHSDPSVVTIRKRSLSFELPASTQEIAALRRPQLIGVPAVESNPSFFDRMKQKLKSVLGLEEPKPSRTFVAGGSSPTAKSNGAVVERAQKLVDQIRDLNSEADGLRNRGAGNQAAPRLKAAELTRQLNDLVSSGNLSPVEIKQVETKLAEAGLVQAPKLSREPSVISSADAGKPDAKGMVEAIGRANHDADLVRAQKQAQALQAEAEVLNRRAKLAELAQSGSRSPAALPPSSSSVERLKKAAVELNKQAHDVVRSVPPVETYYQRALDETAQAAREAYVHTNLPEPVVREPGKALVKYEPQSVALTKAPSTALVKAEPRAISQLVGETPAQFAQLEPAAKLNFLDTVSKSQVSRDFGTEFANNLTHLFPNTLKPPSKSFHLTEPTARQNVAAGGVMVGADIFSRYANGELVSSKDIMHSSLSAGIGLKGFDLATQGVQRGTQLLDAGLNRLATNAGTAVARSVAGSAAKGLGAASTVGGGVMRAVGSAPIVAAQGFLIGDSIVPPEYQASGAQLNSQLQNSDSQFDKFIAPHMSELRNLRNQSCATAQACQVLSQQVDQKVNEVQKYIQNHSQERIEIVNAYRDSFKDNWRSKIDGTWAGKAVDLLGSNYISDFNRRQDDFISKTLANVGTSEENMLQQAQLLGYNAKTQIAGQAQRIDPKTAQQILSTNTKTVEAKSNGKLDAPSKDVLDYVSGNTIDANRQQAIDYLSTQALLLNDDMGKELRRIDDLRKSGSISDSLAQKMKQDLNKDYATRMSDLNTEIQAQKLESQGKANGQLDGGASQRVTTLKQAANENTRYDVINAMKAEAIRLNTDMGKELNHINALKASGTISAQQAQQMTVDLNKNYLDRMNTLNTQIQVQTNAGIIEGSLTKDGKPVGGAHRSQVANVASIGEAPKIDVSGAGDIDVSDLPKVDLDTESNARTRARILAGIQTDANGAVDRTIAELTKPPVPQTTEERVMAREQERDRRIAGLQSQIDQTKDSKVRKQLEQQIRDEHTQFTDDVLKIRAQDVFASASSTGSDPSGFSLGKWSSSMGSDMNSVQNRWNEMSMDSGTRLTQAQKVADNQRAAIREQLNVTTNKDERKLLEQKLKDIDKNYKAEVKEINQDAKMADLRRNYLQEANQDAYSQRKQLEQDLEAGRISQEQFDQQAQQLDQNFETTRDEVLAGDKDKDLQKAAKAVASQAVKDNSKRWGACALGAYATIQALLKRNGIKASKKAAGEALDMIEKLENNSNAPGLVPTPIKEAIKEVLFQLILEPEAYATTTAASMTSNDPCVRGFDEYHKASSTQYLHCALRSDSELQQYAGPNFVHEFEQSMRIPFKDFSENAVKDPGRAITLAMNATRLADPKKAQAVTAVTLAVQNRILSGQDPTGGLATSTVASSRSPTNSQAGSPADDEDDYADAITGVEGEQLSPLRMPGSSHNAGQSENQDPAEDRRMSLFYRISNRYQAVIQRWRYTETSQ